MITQEQIKVVVDKIAQSVNPDRIVLFGSYAYGSPDEESDLDLLVIKDTDLSMYKRSAEIRKHLRGLKVPMDILVYTREEIRKWQDVKGAFINHVMRKGKVVYGKEAAIN